MKDAWGRRCHVLEGRPEDLRTRRTTETLTQIPEGEGGAASQVDSAAPPSGCGLEGKFRPGSSSGIGVTSGTLSQGRLLGRVIEIVYGG